ncbi:MAG: alpha/beta hydrolase [Campylobacterota bacterium]|nr:alpha/beta hydrolase [Campylobacterota bacterium]
MLSQLLLWLIQFIFILYITIALLFYFLQGSLIFPTQYVPKEIKVDPHFQKITFATENKVTLEGMIMITDLNAPTLLYFGGNAENVLYNAHSFASFQNYNWIAFNYRGYGQSEDKASKKYILQDALKIYDYFNQKYSIETVMGRSLGSSVATYLASQRDIQKLIIITPFDSIINVAFTHYPFLHLFPTKAFLKHNFDTQEYMTKLKAKVYMLVASDDKIIPKVHSDKLKTSIVNLQEYQAIEGGHNSINHNPKYREFILKSLKL